VYIGQTLEAPYITVILIEPCLFCVHRLDIQKLQHQKGTLCAQTNNKRCVQWCW